MSAFREQLYHHHADEDEAHADDGRQIQTLLKEDPRHRWNQHDAHARPNRVYHPCGHVAHGQWQEVKRHAIAHNSHHRWPQLREAIGRFERGSGDDFGNNGDD